MNKDKIIATRITSKEYEVIREIAYQNRMNVSSYIRLLIYNVLEQYKEKGVKNNEK